jgi:hypothetical protein
MHVPENGTNLVQSTIILHLYAALLLGDESGALLEILMILKVTKVSLVHLARHLLKVFEDSHLILLSFLAQESLIVIFVINQPMLSGVLGINRCWVTSEEDLAGVKFLKHFIMFLKFLSHFLDSLSFQGIEIWEVDCRRHHIAGIEALEGAVTLSYLEG